MPSGDVDELFDETTDEDAITEQEKPSEDLKRVEEEFSNSDLFD